MGINTGQFSQTDVWPTPQSFFDKLMAEFRFTLDAAALPDNAKCSRYFTPADDGLLQSWQGETVFLNPPYDRRLIPMWLKKAYQEAAGANVVLLIPVRSDVRWWHEYVMQAHEIRLVKGRLHNEQGGAWPMPVAVVVFRNRSQHGRPDSCAVTTMEAKAHAIAST